MKITDLTHTITDDISVFSATEHPKITVAAEKEKDGYSQKHISIYSHNGTHMDAPFHILKDGVTADEMPVESFFGKACVADFSGISAREISLEAIKTKEKEMKESDFLLIHTGWDKKWKTDDYSDGFPVLSVEAANYLTNFNLKGVGVDAISVDTIDSAEMPVHHALLGAGMILIENLTNLSELPESGVYFSAFPLKIKEADGSPIRAVAIEW
jgi:kynurenine formamidase